MSPNIYNPSKLTSPPPSTAHPDDFVEELDRYRSSNAPSGGGGIGGGGGSAGGSIASGSGPGPRTPQRRSDVGGLGGSVFTPVPVDNLDSHLTQQLRVARSGGNSSVMAALVPESTPAASHSHRPNEGYADYAGSGMNGGAGSYKQHPINIIREDPHWQHERDSSYTGPRTFASSCSNREGLRFVVGKYTATISYDFLLLLVSPARVQTL